MRLFSILCLKFQYAICLTHNHHTSKVLLFPSVMDVGNARSMVLAATVKIHGAVLCTVYAEGPSFAAPQTTVMPLATAWNEPVAMPSRSSTSENRGMEDPIDKDKTSTPSCMASSKALSISADEHWPPSISQQTLYMAKRARGAPPLTVPDPRPL